MTFNIAGDFESGDRPPIATNIAGQASVTLNRNFAGTDIVIASFGDDQPNQIPVDGSTETKIVDWVADFDGDGLPDATDPEPFGQHADPTFSQVPNAPDGVCICTPPMMNNQGGELQRPGSQVQD